MTGDHLTPIDGLLEQELTEDILQCGDFVHFFLILLSLRITGVDLEVYIALLLLACLDTFLKIVKVFLNLIFLRVTFAHNKTGDIQQLLDRSQNERFGHNKHYGDDRKATEEGDEN